MLVKRFMGLPPHQSITSWYPTHMVWFSDIPLCAIEKAQRDRFGSESPGQYHHFAGIRTCRERGKQQEQPGTSGFGRCYSSATLARTSAARVWQSIYRNDNKLSELFEDFTAEGESESQAEKLDALENLTSGSSSTN